MIDLNQFKEDHEDLCEFAQKINNFDDIELLDLFKSFEFDQNKLFIIIQMISYFVKYRPHSFDIISRFILNISDALKKNFQENDIINAFKNSSQKLLDFLFDQNIISQKINESNSTEAPIYTSFYIQNLETTISEDETTEKDEKNAKDETSSIRKIIQRDDISSFQSFISQTNENIDSDFLKTKIQRDSQFFNAFEKQCQKYIEYAALFGSIQIFKYLWLNNAVVTDNLFPLSIYGGNFEIIHLVESKINNDQNYSTKIQQIMNKSVTAAVFCFRHELVSYLCENYSIKFEYAALHQSLVSFNYTDLLYMIDYDPSVLNSFSDDLHETIFHNPNHFSQYDIIEYILSNYLKLNRENLNDVHNFEEIQIGLKDKIVLN